MNRQVAHIQTIRVREIRRTCPANFENVQRRSLISPDKMPSEKFGIRQTVKCLARIPNVRRRIVGSPDKMSGEAQMNFAYSETMAITVAGEMLPGLLKDLSMPDN